MWGIYWRILFDLILFTLRRENRKYRITDLFLCVSLLLQWVRQRYEQESGDSSDMSLSVDGSNVLLNSMHSLRSFAFTFSIISSFYFSMYFFLGRMCREQ